MTFSNVFSSAFDAVWTGVTTATSPVQTNYYLHMDGAGYVNCGADATLQDLAVYGFSVDFWTRVEQPAHFLISRAPFREGSGWLVDNYAGGIDRYTYWTPVASLVLSGGQAYSIPSWDIFDVPINTWAHLAVIFDTQITHRIHIAVNGVWCTYLQQDVFSGTPINDAGNSLLIGADNGYDGPSNRHHGDFAWVRISNTHRWTIGENFTPPEMTAAPAVDGNTLELWTFDEGSGTTAAASVTPANAGTLVGTVTWGEH